MEADVEQVVEKETDVSPDPVQEQEAELPEPEFEFPQEVPVYVELVLAEPGVFTARLVRATMITDHAFGEFAQYKGRHIQSFLNLEPAGVAVRANVPEGMTLAELVAMILTEQVRACEIVVREADAREEGARRERDAELLAVVEEARLRQAAQRKVERFKQEVETFE